MKGLGPGCHRQSWEVGKFIDMGNETVDFGLLIFENVVCGGVLYCGVYGIVFLMIQIFPYKPLWSLHKQPFGTETQYTAKALPNKNDLTIHHLSIHLIGTYYPCQDCSCSRASTAVQASFAPPSSFHLSPGDLKWSCNPSSMSCSALGLLPGWSPPINLCLQNKL